MISRRTAVAFFLSPYLSFAAGLDKLAGRWRSRITVVRSGRPLHTRLRLTFAPDGGFAIEEFDNGGQLAWIYKGAARLSADNELFLDVSAVTDPNGRAPEENRARYQAGESYNLGGVEYLSTARVRVGAMELQKELE